MRGSRSGVESKRTGGGNQCSRSGGLLFEPGLGRRCELPFDRFVESVGWSYIAMLRNLLCFQGNCQCMGRSYIANANRTPRIHESRHDMSRWCTLARTHPIFWVLNSIKFNSSYKKAALRGAESTLVSREFSPGTRYFLGN